MSSCPSSPRKMVATLKAVGANPTEDSNIFIIFVYTKYNKMEEKKLRQGTIGWHEAQIEKIKSRKRGKAKKKEKVIPNRGKVSVQHDFLKYIRIVMRWAVENSTLNRPHVEALLYLYGCGTFSKKQFQDFHKTIGMYEQKTLDTLTKEGWVVLWRPAQKSKRIHALYTLSHKAKLFCSKIHKVCCGLEEIPTEETKNKLAGKTGKRIDTYYMDMIKRMNRDKAENKGQ